MQKNIIRKADGYASQHRHRRIWRKVMGGLACVVVFCTIYALIMPAITMEKTRCGIPEHTHTEDCYTQVTTVTKKEPICTLESLNLHKHTAGCFDENGEPICGYSDFVVHEHDSSCYDEDGNLWCPLSEIKAHTHNSGCYAAAEPVHTHTEDCYTQERGDLICTEEEREGHTHSVEAGCFDENGTLICQAEEETGHRHTDDCYSWEQVLSCGLTDTETAGEPELVCGKEEIILHEHGSGCFDASGRVICGKRQVLEHVHNQDCFQTVEEPADTKLLTCQLEENEGHRHGPLCYGTWELTCDLEEHIHTEDCSPQIGVDDHALTEADPTVVVQAVVWLTGEDVVCSDSGQVMALMSSVSPYAESSPGDIADHLTSAQIEINGKPYDGESALNPGEQFTVALQWQLNRADLTDTLTYAYRLPNEIHVKDMAETVLYDENNNRKGVYSIVDGVLTVTYDNLADLNTTSFKLNATWNQEKINQETTVKWNDQLSTQVKFDNSQIAVTKELMRYKTIEDGSVIAEYAVNVAASGAVENIALTDTLTSEKFHFCQGYYKVNEEIFDYRYKIVNADGSEEYQYAKFPEGTFDENGKQLTDTITFPKFNLAEGQTYTVEYAVKLDADERFELDKDQSAAGLTNSATASYPSGEDTIKSSVTVTDAYRADEKWILKEQGNLGEGDVDQNTDVPWKVTVNPARDYDMGEAVISDSIQTEGVVYKTDGPITITSTTKESSGTITPTWITLSDKTVSDIRSAGGNAANLLYSSGYENYLNEISTAVGHNVSRNELSNYVFVGESKNQFVWFTPETGTPTTYELSYITDISNATSGSLVNSAEAGWRSWTAGVVNGSFLQEINIKKENDGVYQKDDNYFVDWTITLDVPADCNAIPGVFLYDALPDHGKSGGGYDRLVGLNASEFDFSQLQSNKLTYLNTIAQPAFKISTTSNNEDVQTIVKNAAATLGYPGVGLTGEDYELYEGNDTLRGQFPIMNGGETYNNHRMTPTRFGVWLGDLPATTGKDGYTITVQYTTQVDPKLVEGLNGRAYGYNVVGLFQRQGNTDAFLGDADSGYWLDHANVQNALAKSVVAFDSERNIVTYQVNINPDASLEASGFADYILRDVLNLSGASFIENSFQLSFQGTVTDQPVAFTWDSSEETILWRSDNGEVGLSPGLSAGMKDLTSFNVENPADGSSQFTLTLTNGNNVFALTGPEEFKGRLAPMVLTYQVKLPAGAEKPEQETITNSVTLSMKPADSSEVLLDGVKTEFDYTSALHKWLNEVPNEHNGYTAAFIISVDKSAEEWKNVSNTFTVSDEMSKSLMVDVNSIKVYGIKKDNTEELLSDQYTSSYDDRANELKNFLSITIMDSDEYTKYRIEYNASVQGEVEHTVAYDNVASVEGTDISSEEVIKEVYIQKQEGNVDETNYEVKLLKFDAENTAVRLKATFTLYAWEDGNWTKKRTDLTTDENGELVLNNTKYEGLGLGPNIWYKLEETEAPAGYLKGVTYFHIGQTGEDETRPEGIGSYTTVSLKGGTHQIPNYKASIRIHKMDEEKESSSYLTGAEFALYGTPDCSETPLAVAKEDRKGIYSFELTGLIAGQEYYLKETKAPDGYQLSDTVYALSFDQEGNVTLKNGNEFAQTDSGGAYLIANRSNYELPQTGGFGTTPYTLGGLLLTGAGVLLLYNKKKRRKEDFASS